jgi:ubiquinol-cytochrome c reductase cytochrome b subunit
MQRMLDALESRLGFRKPLEAFLDEPIAGGASWRYVFGSALVFTFALQALTGILLAFYYAPTPASAWASTFYIQEKVTHGWFLRGLHSFGAMAMVVLLTLHMLQTFAAGAHRKPRELNWIVGVFLAAIVLAFAATGYTLPWDQRALAHTRVMTGLASAISSALGDALRGGNDIGQLTLTRYYAIHTLVLPALLLALLALHLWLFRRHGVTTPASLSPEEAFRRAQRFWPGQAMRDGVFAALVFCTIVALTLFYEGAPLQAPADHSQPTEAGRPEWYFLWLFQLLKYVPGEYERTVLVVLPAGVLLFLCALPFLDRGPRRGVAARLYGAALFSGVAALVTLTSLALFDDASSASFQKKREASRRLARKAFALAAQGIPPEGPAAMLSRALRADGGVSSAGASTSPNAAAAMPTTSADPGLALFSRKCGGCHPYQGAMKKRKGPDLTNWGTRAWLTAFFENPRAPEKYGYDESNFLKKGGMPNLKLSPAEVRAYVEWIFREAGEPHDAALAKEGRQSYDDNGCEECHGIGEVAKGPDLRGWWSRAWLVRVLTDPADEHLYGTRNQMKKPRLTDEERTTLVDWLLAARRGPKPPLSKP